MLMRLSEINDIVRGQMTGADPEISAVSIDTRTLQSGDLYIAIKGENFDGNDFVKHAETAGAAAAILPRPTTLKLPHIVVEDTRIAMAELAGAVRKLSSAPLLGITGSNGKTTVKEMAAAILSVQGNVLFTRGNLNNDIGVPLTLLRLNEQHQYAVVEMGANHPGEIRFTSQYAAPDVSVITNVGPAHIEGFGDIDGVAKAKSELIEALGQGGTAVLNADDRYFDFWRTVAAGRQVISFAIDNPADVTASAISMNIIDGQFRSEFEFRAKGESVSVAMQLAGRHNVNNALAAGAACLSLGIGLKQIKQGLESVKPVAGRLQPILGNLGNIIINDSYNANPASLEAALDVLCECAGEHWVVLGAFGELGSRSKEIHEDLGELIKSRRVVRFLAIGPEAENSVRNFGVGAAFFDSQDDLIDTLKRELKGNETVLIKGSRSQHMEKVVAELVGGRGI